MPLIEYLENILVYIGSLTKIFLEAMGILTVLLGVIINFRYLISLCRHPSHRNYIIVRTRIGQSLALALEFQLGADVVSTTLSATYGNFAKLAIIALIRTFLNYFLSQEMKEFDTLNSSSPQKQL